MHPRDNERPPPDGSTHWSTRKLAKVLGISHVPVSRVWRRAGLQPHRFERYMSSNDPNFEEKAADGLDAIVSAWVGARYLARKAKPYGDARHRNLGSCPGMTWPEIY